jgi:hypothetical protein
VSLNLQSIAEGRARAANPIEEEKKQTAKSPKKVRRNPPITPR